MERRSHFRLGPGAFATATALAMLALSAGSSEAAGVRGDFRTNVALVETRGFERHTLPIEQVPGEGVYRQLEDGTVVTCIPGSDVCYWYTQGDVESSMPVSQDLRLNGWANVQGLSGKLHVRGRFGSDEFWPRTEEEIELVTGYAELDRGRLRIRGGRTSSHNGLGFYEFDGGSALLRTSGMTTIEFYGGRSLARGTSQPLDGFLLEDADILAPNDPGWIVGGQAQLILPRRSRVAVAYQREIRQDRAALYEERGALDVHMITTQVTIDTQIDYDFATERLQDARVRVDSPRMNGYRASGALRYRRPYFSLWTIWEAFAPVGYREAWSSLSWSDSRGRAGFQATASYRIYDDTNVIDPTDSVENDGWQVAALANWNPNPWRIDGGYKIDWGFAAAESQFDLGITRDFGRLELGAQGFASEQVREFRNGEDWILGGGVRGRFDSAPWSVEGSAGVYRLSYENRADYADWSQKRAYLALGYSFGSDPGMVHRSQSMSGTEKEVSR